tara:strand:+ start:1506 stop:2969 length:1464 start_codon:yes stop_codon:yes gene_type:complete
LNNSKTNLISNKNVIPVILSGGSGTRLWPLSRECFPKQYINICEENNFSLLQNTFLRLQGIKRMKEPIIICNEEQRFIVAEQMRQINVNEKSIILEPEGRNTAPAIAISSLIASEQEQDPLILVLSADHKIADESKFKKTISEAFKYAEDGRIVTFGVIPTHPETGFGYIESTKLITKNSNSSQIKRFIEKPNISLAKKIFNNQNFTWNSGIFLFKASVMLEELKRYEPEMIKLCNKAIQGRRSDLDFIRINEEFFKKCPNLPIDIAVMEKTNLGTVVALDAGWNDIGNWESVWDTSRKNEDGNVLIGKTIIEKSKNSYLRSEDRLVVAVGVKDLVVVETKDAVMVINKKEAQNIKNIVSRIKENYLEGKLNKKMFRPWGSFSSVESGSSWQVKTLEINPKASLSLQMHHHRSEHWVVVNGTAKVEIDNKIELLGENKSIYVPRGSKHRLSNPGEIPLVIIEVQSGTYLGEDDIVRFDDIYGRPTST